MPLSLWRKQDQFCFDREIAEGQEHHWHINNHYKRSSLRILQHKYQNFEVLEKNMAGVEAKPLKKVNKPYKIRREGSFVNGFR